MSSYPNLPLLFFFSVLSPLGPERFYPGLFCAGEVLSFLVLARARMLSRFLMPRNVDVFVGLFSVSTTALVWFGLVGFALFTCSPTRVDMSMANNGRKKEKRF